MLYGYPRSSATVFLVVDRIDHEDRGIQGDEGEGIWIRSNTWIALSGLGVHYRAYGVAPRGDAPGPGGRMAWMIPILDPYKHLIKNMLFRSPATVARIVVHIPMRVGVYEGIGARGIWIRSYE